MSIFVTAIYDLFKLEPTRAKLFNHSIEDYLGMFLKLLKADLNFYIFLDENFYEKFKTQISPVILSQQNRGFFVKIKFLPYSDIPYAHLVPSLFSLYERGKVFSDYNTVKDTPNFMALMYSKVDFLLIASQDADCSQFKNYHWIDAGIFYLIPRYELSYDFGEYLAEISHHPVDKIVFCYMNTINGPDNISFFQRNYYYLCGGFFSVPKDLIGWFSAQMKDTVNLLISNELVNIDEMCFAWICKHNRDKFELYHGNYDTMIIIRAKLSL